LDLGSAVDTIIYGSKQQLRIVGIGLAPNYIWAIPPGDLTADESRFGIFWIGTKALEGMTDRTSAINALSLTLERGASETDVIRSVDRLLEPYGGAGASGREDHISHAFLQNELNQLKALNGVIPPVFLLVSAFLVYVVLTRMIGTERTQIGLIKAFGYSDWAIGPHYLGFALAIACVASVLGSVAGIWLGRGITAIYAESFRFPFLSFRIALPVFLAAGALSFAAAVLGALGGVLSAVRLSPAVAMSPPPAPVYRAGCPRAMWWCLIPVLL
nr:ABC transporter permease [Porphyrobacter sp.]